MSKLFLALLFCTLTLAAASPITDENEAVNLDATAASPAKADTTPQKTLEDHLDDEQDDDDVKLEFGDALQMRTGDACGWGKKKDATYSGVKQTDGSCLFEYSCTSGNSMFCRNVNNGVKATDCSSGKQCVKGVKSKKNGKNFCKVFPTTKGGTCKKALSCKHGGKCCDSCYDSSTQSHKSD